jgi:hypothetical protein
MTSADFNHTDKLAVEKKEKLEWVTPKMTFMVAEDTEGGEENPLTRMRQHQHRIQFTDPPDLPDHLGINPAHSNKNQ